MIVGSLEVDDSLAVICAFTFRFQAVRRNGYGPQRQPDGASGRLAQLAAGSSLGRWKCIVPLIAAAMILVLII